MIIMLWLQGLVINYSIKSEILLLQKEMQSPDSLPLCLTVRRDHFLQDAMREAKKKKFCPRKRIKVCLCHNHLS